jgi:hypothetical protein
VLEVVQAEPGFMGQRADLEDAADLAYGPDVLPTVPEPVAVPQEGEVLLQVGLCPSREGVLCKHLPLEQVQDPLQVRIDGTIRDAVGLQGAGEQRNSCRGFAGPGQGGVDEDRVHEGP